MWLNNSLPTSTLQNFCHITDFLIWWDIFTDQDMERVAAAIPGIQVLLFRCGEDTTERTFETISKYMRQLRELGILIDISRTDFVEHLCKWLPHLQSVRVGPPHEVG